MSPNIVIRECLDCGEEGKEDSYFTYHYPANYWSCKSCGSSNVEIKEIVDSDD